MLNRYKLFLLGLLLINIACNDIPSAIRYTYGGVTIERIDEGNRTSFYYKTAPNQKSNGKIYVQYAGINDGFSGYLRFHDNGQVELLSGDGHFQMQGVDTSQFVYKRIIATQRPSDIASTCYISLSTKQEKKRNAKSISKIKIEYINGEE